MIIKLFEQLTNDIKSMYQQLSNTQNTMGKISLFFRYPSLRNMFIGLLLGNHIQIHKPRHKVQKIAVSYRNHLKNYPYFREIYDIFYLLFSVNSLSYCDNVYTKIKSSAHPVFLLLRKEFYNEEGRKIIPETIDNYMSEELITLLYLEQGYLEKRFTKNQYAFDVSKYDIDSIENLKTSIEAYFKINLILKYKKKKKSLIIIKELDLKKMELIFKQYSEKHFKLMSYKIESIVGNSKMKSTEKKAWKIEYLNHELKPNILLGFESFKEHLIERQKDIKETVKDLQKMREINKESLKVLKKIQTNLDLVINNEKNNVEKEKNE